MKRARSEQTASAVKPSKRDWLRERGFFRPYVRVTVIGFIVGLLVYILARLIPAFAEFWARYPSQAIRCVLSVCTGILHSSVAEWVIFSLPVLIGGYCFFSARSLKRDESPINYYRWLLPILCGILVVLTLFLAVFGPCYFRYSLAENLQLEDHAVSGQELYDTALILCNELNALQPEITFLFDGESVMPYHFDDLVDRVNDAYAKYAAGESYISHFPSRAKPLASSPIYTYTHISGVYTFMTGEVNINLNYPDFILPFTVAHEFSHQRGIAKEEEANFVAYLVCIGSDDAFVRYSGYANMLQYLTDALYRADRDLYRQLFANHVPGLLKGEFSSYSAFFRKYSNNPAATVTNAVNNTFLTSQGEKAGTASYGLVVDLAVAYYKARS